MDSSNDPLRVSKNKPPSGFSKRYTIEQKINEENIENNLVFCIDPRIAFAIKSIPRFVFFFLEIRHIRTKYVYFLFRLDLNFGFFIKP